MFSQEASMFAKFRDFQMFDLGNGNLVAAQTFYSAYASSWRFACAWLWRRTKLEKYAFQI